MLASNVERTLESQFSPAVLMMLMGDSAVPNVVDDTRRVSTVVSVVAAEEMAELSEMFAELRVLTSQSNLLWQRVQGKIARQHEAHGAP